VNVCDPRVRRQIHDAVTQGLPSYYSIAGPRITDKLLTVEQYTGNWSWTAAHAIVLDEVDALDESTDVTNYEVARIVTAIDGGLSPEMRFTVTTGTDRMLKADA
jgi:hypothetical protein